MEFTEFVRELLDIGEEFRITKIERSEASPQMFIKIFLEYAYAECAVSGGVHKVYDYAPERTWQHLHWFQYPCYIVCRLPRYIDIEGKVKTLEPIFASKGKSYTHLFSAHVIDALQQVKVQQVVANMFTTTSYTVRSIMEDAVQEGLTQRGAVQNLQRVSLDEKAFARGHQYASILIDSDKDYVVEMVEGRDEAHVQMLFFLSTLQLKQSKLKRVNIDMWRPYINAIKAIAPRAKIVHDKFHLIQKLSEAIDKTRRKEVLNEPLLKKNKYTALKNAENRTNEQQAVFDQLDKENLKTAQAWHIRENFKTLFDIKAAGSTPAQAKSILLRWMESSKEKRLIFVNKVIQTIENHLQGVINALTSRSSSGKHENLNGRIQSVLAKARGFANFERFRINVLFYFGNLNLLPLKFY